MGHFNLPPGKFLWLKTLYGKGNRIIYFLSNYMDVIFAYLLDLYTYNISIVTSNLLIITRRSIFRKFRLLLAQIEILISILI